jgi:outer membrane receptor for ferrienterochelin and colicins
MMAQSNCRNDGRTHQRGTISFSASAIALALTTLAPSSSYAQAIDYGSLEQLFGESVTTSATGSPQRATEVPANMEIITADEIRRSGADNIPDILQFIAGVDVRRYGFAQAEVSVRGYNQQFSPRLLVLINGRQVYLDDYGHTAWQSLPVQLDEIRQIEVVKGPNSALFGFNAVGGVINIITYDPLLDSTNAVTVRGGTQAYASGSAVMTLHADDKAGLRLSLGGFRAKEFSTSSLPPALNPYYQSPYQFSFSGDGRLKLSPNVELTLEGTVANARNFDALPVPGFFDDIYRTNSLKFGVAADTAFGLLNVTAYRNELNFELENTAGDVLDTNRVYVVQANDLFKLGTNHTVRLGLEYRDNSASSTIFGGKLGYGVYAASAMWIWQIAPELALTNAVRFDHLALRYAGSPVPGIRYTIADYNAARLSELSFNSGLVFKPTDSDTFRLLVARGIQAPSLVDFGLQTSNNIGGFPISFIGNPNVSAAKMMNYEFDYDRSITSINSILRTAVYYEKTDDLLTSAVNAPLAPGAGGLVSYAQNIGSSSATGGELGLKSAHDSGIRWSASYGFIFMTDHFSIGTPGSSSDLLDYDEGSPASVVNVGAGYSWNRFDVDAQMRWQSHFTDFGPNVMGSVQPLRINNYVTLNTRIGYRMTNNITLALTGEQLAQPRTLGAAGTPVERRVFVTLSVKY